MGRPRVEGDPVGVGANLQRDSDEVEFDCWLYLSGTLGSHLAGGIPDLAVIEVIDEAIRLDGTKLPVAARIEALGQFAVSRGARQRDVDRLVEHARKTTADRSWAIAQARPDALTRHLSTRA